MSTVLFFTVLSLTLEPFCSYCCCNKLLQINYTHLLTYWLWRSEIKNWSYGAKIKVLAGLHPSGVSRGKPISLPFLAFKGRLHCTVMFLPPLPKCLSIFCSHCHISCLSDGDLLLEPLWSFHKDPCNYIGPCQKIQADLCISRFFIQAHLKIPFCCVRWHIHRFWRLGHRHL